MDYNEIKKIKLLYKQNKNVLKYLRKSSKNNSLEAILYSYDLQSGSYTDKVKKLKYIKKNYDNIGKLIAGIIKDSNSHSILEAGAGEGNTLTNVLKYTNSQKNMYYGFDISASRLLYAQKLIQQRKNLKLFTSELSNIPLPDNSIDLVYTVHAIEPNYGREKVIINELFRICKKYLVLIEPSYELGNNTTRNHIIYHGYCRNLPQIIKKTGHNIIKNELTNFNFNKNNENTIIVAKKRVKKYNIPNFISPISKKLINKKKDCFYCKYDGYAFPIIHDIPLLTKDSGILISKLDSF